MKMLRCLGIAVMVTQVCLASSARAVIVRTGDNVYIERAERIDDDVFIASGNTTVSGVISGDLVAIGNKILFTGEVDNSINAGAQTIDIDGVVRNSVRAFCQNLTVRGFVERNVMAFCASTIIEREARIDRDLVVYSGEVLLRGRIRGNVTGEADAMTIAGQVEGNVDLQKVNRLVILKTAVIGGDVVYGGLEDPPQIESGAQILGEVRRVEVEDDDGGYTVGTFLWDLIWYCAAVVVGILLNLLFGGFMRLAVDQIVHSFWRSLGMGVLFYYGLLIAGLVFLLTIIGIPTALVTLGGWWFLRYAARVFVGIALGGLMFGYLRDERKRAWVLPLLSGLLIFEIVAAIPYLGNWVATGTFWLLGGSLAIFLGFGGCILAAMAYRAQMAKSTQSPF